MDTLARERAFKHDLFLNEIWSDRYFDLIVKNLSLHEAETILYLNAGTGRNCFRLAENHSAAKQIVGVCDSPEHLVIARDKAKVSGSDILFVTETEVGNKYDLVIADATLSDSESVTDLLSSAAGLLNRGGQFALIVPIFGSYAEVFSLLWEVLASAEGGSPEAVERLITALPRLDALEIAARETGLHEVKSEVSTEIFEFEKPEDFTDSPLFADFLLPGWLADIDKTALETIRKKIAELIEQEHGNLAFRFQVKAAVITGKS